MKTSNGEFVTTLDDELAYQILKRERRLNEIDDEISRLELDYVQYQWEMAVTPLEQYEQEKRVGKKELEKDIIIGQIDNLNYLRACLDTQTLELLV